MQNTTTEFEFVLDADQSVTTSPLLIATLDWAKRSGVWQPMRRLLDVKMKTLTYSPLQKLQTVIASIIVGCQFNEQINQRLVPDPAAAELLDMTRFPDQSQVNILLRRLDDTNLGQLASIHAEHLDQYADWLIPNHWRGYLIVDIDQCGLVANGKSYGLTHTGYFARRRGERGYQLSAAYLSSEQLTLALSLDSGNVSGYMRLHEMISQVSRRLAAHRRRVVFRLDAGYGAQPQVRYLVKHDYLFILKARLNKPEKWAAKVAPEHWHKVAGRPDVQVGEVAAGPLVRAIVCAVSLPDGRIEYGVLFTNLPAEKYAATEMWGLYQGRQGIEAFFKTCGQTYGMSNLRSTEFRAISAYLWLVFITHNLLQWVKRDLFAGSALAAVGTHELVSKLGRIVAWRERTPSGWRLHLPSFDALARRFGAALTPDWVQLELRLYET